MRPWGHLKFATRAPHICFKWNYHVHFGKQPLSLGMMRSDLMLDSGTCQTTCDDCDPISSPYCCFKQVEINTIASGFGWMGPASGLIHRSVISSFTKSIHLLFPTAPASVHFRFVLSVGSLLLFLHSFVWLSNNHFILIHILANLWTNDLEVP